ncbi:MAG: IS1595 family transposase [Bacillota bacterium]
MIAGTVLEGTRKPLRVWFQTMWYVTSQKNGGNALGLKRILGFGSYQTAWSWLHKMRRAMVRPGRDHLSGRACGRRNLRWRKRSSSQPSRSVSSSASGGSGLDKSHVSVHSLVPFVRDVIVPESVVLTDGWQGYAMLSRYGYTHEKTIMSASWDPAHVAMPGVHRVASLLKRWLLGTHHGAVGERASRLLPRRVHIRFNRRTSKARGLLFYRLLQQSVQTSPTPYRQLAGGRPHLTHGSEE